MLLPSNKTKAHFVVGLGASAGGLEAITSLLRKLPHDIGCSYVIVQHQSPTYKSMLVQLLSRETKMKVVEISASCIPKPNTVYITPASHNVLINHKKLKLVDLEEGVMPRPSINTFFQSLAEGYAASGDRQVYAISTQSSEVTAERQSQKERELAAKVFDGASDGVAILNQEFKIIAVNSSYERITGFQKNNVIGKKSIIVNELTHTISQRELIEKLDQDKFWSGEIEFTKFDKNKIILWLSLSAVVDEDENTITYIVIFNDITNYKDSQKRIEFLATHDPLTGLANRHLLSAQLDAKIAVAKRNNSAFAIMFIDVDNFKNINDSLEHHIGDLVLQKISQRLKDALREADLIARLGGDEFAIILDGVSEQQLKRLAERVVISLNKPIQIEPREISVSASVGISIYPEHGETSLTLLKTADVAMYNAKDSGKNTFQFFKSEMANIVNERINMQNDIRVAINEHQFTLVYQPQVNLNTTKLCGLEALIRWQHPVKGNIAPSDFIPIAESTGLIDDISFWIFEEVFRQALEWSSQGVDVPKISINLSAKNFKNINLDDYLTSLKAKFPIEDFKFGIEFTETAIIEDAIYAHSLFNIFKKHGAEISLDDFGTGYSSFIYLKKFPIDQIKIDKTFVDDIGARKEDYEITKAIISVASSLRISSMAEGVETTEQLNLLRQLGCENVQGYLIAKPLPPEKFTLWANNWFKKNILH